MKNDFQDFLEVFSADKKIKKDKEKLFEELSFNIKKDNPFRKSKEITDEGSHLWETTTVPPTPPVAEPKPPNIIKQEDTGKYIIEKYTGKSFQQPDPDPPKPEIKSLQDKVKFLEKWLGKISAHGPGSGEVNFRYLDDVNRNTLTDGNNNWVLEYDTTSKKVQFTNEIGPINHVAFDINHVDDAGETPGTICWNTGDHTLNIHHENGVTQQIGQEQFYLIKNTSESTISNGSVCMFGGAFQDTNEARLVGVPFIANGTFPSLYIMGVSTEDILPGAEGFVTSFGKVRGLDTTGDIENWQAGDILYASPTVAGGLTKIKPTAPNNVIPIAACVKVDNTIGEIFVRPTIEQKFLYGRFSDTTDQTPVAINTPYAITFNTTDISRGVYADGGVNPTSMIFVDESGFYKFQTGVSLTSTNSSAKTFWIWARKNGTDIPNSARRQTVTGNNTYQILNYDIEVSLNANDHVEIMYATDDVTISINSPSATAFAPAIPSVTLTVNQIAL